MPATDGGRRRVVDVGLFARAILGVVGVLFVTYQVLSRLSLVVVPPVWPSSSRPQQSRRPANP